MSASVWRTSRFEIDLARPRVMGIVNVTPDSFSEGGADLSPGQAIARCEQLLQDGADVLDIGGESSRPGALPVSAEVELARVRPVLEAALGLGCPVSIDTNKVDVMRAALDLGVDIVNDIGALRGPGALEAVAAHPRCGVCLMHMRGTPRSMHAEAVYDDVTAEVTAFLSDLAIQRSVSASTQNQALHAIVVERIDRHRHGEIGLASAGGTDAEVDVVGRDRMQIAHLIGAATANRTALDLDCHLVRALGRARHRREADDAISDSPRSMTGKATMRSRKWP